MSSLKQYIDLYRDNREAIDSNSATVINALRPDALAALEGKTLPTQGTEGYEKTSIDKMMAPDFGININRVNIPVDVAASFRCDVPNMSTLMSFIVNDSYIPAASLHKKLPEGVIVDSLAKAAAKYPELVARHYGKTAPLSNPGVALNTLLAQDGMMIYIPQGVKMEKQIGRAHV